MLRRFRADRRAEDGLSRAAQLLGDASRQIGLLARIAPANAQEERLRVARAWRHGERAVPRYMYAPADVEALRVQLDRFAEHPGLADVPLGSALAARARELALEAELVVHRGTRRFGLLARERFSTFSPSISARASELATAWLASEISPRTPLDGATGDAVAVDDVNRPDSLLRCLEAELASRGIPFRVVVSSELSALAATGHDAVFVARGRSADREATKRTVVHEIDGHVLPRVRAQRAGHPLFRVGSARGTCDQEGYALTLEAENGWLGPRRRRELGLRFRLAERMRAGGTFADTVELAREHGEPVDAALRMAERAHRGGDGAGAGLGREIVYLASYLRVRERIALDPHARVVLSAGQLSCDDVDAARSYAPVPGPA